jgi:hypothetical protein
MQYQLAMVEAELALQEAQLALYNLQARRRRRRRTCWSRAWLGPERRRQFGLYDQLMVELRGEDTESFKNFLRMPPDMYDEIVRRLHPRLVKKSTAMREPLEPGLKVAMTLRHLASGTRYKSMRYGWRVPIFYYYYYSY